MEELLQEESLRVMLLQELLNLPLRTHQVLRPLRLQKMGLRVLRVLRVMHQLLQLEERLLKREMPAIAPQQQQLQLRKKL